MCYVCKCVKCGRFHVHGLQGHGMPEVSNDEVHHRSLECIVDVPVFSIVEGFIVVLEVVKQE